MSEFFTTHLSSTSNARMSQKETHRYKTYSLKKKKRQKKLRWPNLVHSDRKKDELLPTCLQLWRASPTDFCQTTVILRGLWFFRILMLLKI